MFRVRWTYIDAAYLRGLEVNIRTHGVSLTWRLHAAPFGVVLHLATVTSYHTDSIRTRVLNIPAGYESLPQSEDEPDNGQNDVSKSKSRSAPQRSQRPGHIYLRKLDNAFKR